MNRPRHLALALASTLAALTGCGDTPAPGPIIQTPIAGPENAPPTAAPAPAPAPTTP